MNKYLPDSHEEKDHLNRKITSKNVVSVIQQTKAQGPYGYMVNSTKRLKNFPQTLPKNRRVENISKLILWGQHYPDTKTRKGHYKKSRLQANIPDEHRYKNPQNINTPNSTIHWKDHTPWKQNAIYFRDARMVQYPHTTQYNIPH